MTMSQARQAVVTGIIRCPYDHCRRRLILTPGSRWTEGRGTFTATQVDAARGIDLKKPRNYWALHPTASELELEGLQDPVTWFVPGRQQTGVANMPWLIEQGYETCAVECPACGRWFVCRVSRWADETRPVVQWEPQLFTAWTPKTWPQCPDPKLNFQMLTIRQRIMLPAVLAIIKCPNCRSLSLLDGAARNAGMSQGESVEGPKALNSYAITNSNAIIHRQNKRMAVIIRHRNSQLPHANREVAIDETWWPGQRDEHCKSQCSSSVCRETIICGLQSNPTEGSWRIVSLKMKEKRSDRNSS